MSEIGPLPAEFDMIARHLRPLAAPQALGLADDAAVISLPAGRVLVVSADAMVAGVHFLVDDPVDLIARKLLRVNLSDLAAMGAEPLGYLLTIAIPSNTPDAWFAAFARGLAVDQKEFGVGLLGGDTTSTGGPVALSVTMLGTASAGTGMRGDVLRRDGARAGDGLWVSGTIGGGALGLLACRGEIPDPYGVLAARYRLPEPRLSLGRALVGIASACLDVSDGLIQDVGHICRASGLSAEIDAEHVPLPPGIDDSRLALCLTGGDDYELVFAIPPDREGRLASIGDVTATPVRRIGRLHAGPPVVTVLDAIGRPLTLGRPGWSHLDA